MSDDESPNEILAAAKEAKANKARVTGKDSAKPGNNWTLGAIGLGVGIGSAAVAAALIYANREKGDD